jgi:hypothetical protein
LYTKNNIRVSEIISNLEKYLNDINDVRTLGFALQLNMLFLWQKIQFAAGLKAEYLTSKNSKDRDKIRDQFKKKEFNYLLW